MASSRDRQRKLARAKVERQLARRAARARRRRQTQAGLAVGLVVLLVAFGVAWQLGAFKSPPKKVAATATCAWTPQDATANADLKDVGRPPTSGEQRSGTELMTITTSEGVIAASLDAGRAPCTVESMKFLAGRQFFNNTTCQRLVTAGPFALYCGDPTGTGKGGPSYSFATEYVPTAAAPAPSTSPSGAASPAASGSASAPPAAPGSATPAATAPGSASATPGSSAPANVIYPRGTLAMASSGPDSNGSQFFIVYKDSPLPPNYTAFGTVTQGMDVLDKIAKAGAVDQAGKAAADGKPKTTVTIQSLVVTPNAALAAPTTAPAAPPATPPATGATSASAKS